METDDNPHVALGLPKYGLSHSRALCLMQIRSLHTKNNPYPSGGKKYYTNTTY